MTVIRTDAAPAAIGPYSQAIIEGTLLFTSGQLPIDPVTGDLRNSDIVTAAKQALSNLRAVLEAGGADMTTVLKTTVFLSDMGNFQAFNTVYAEFFRAPFPARSCVQVGALPKGALVEIEAVAVLSLYRRSAVAGSRMGALDGIRRTWLPLLPGLSPMSREDAMKIDMSVERILRAAADGAPITKTEAIQLLALPEDSPEAAVLRATANALSRRRFANSGLLLGQIGVDMAPCEGNCAFCFFAKSHTPVQPALLATEEIIARCERFAAGGAQGVFLMTMHRFGFEWFRDLCAELRRHIPPHLEILANVGDVTAEQLQEFRAAGVSGAYHVCRIREGVDSCMDPADRRATIERILEAGLSWYNMCEPLGPEHTPEEIAEQMWLGVELPCTQHGVMQRFPVPGSPLYHYGQVSLPRLGQVVAVVTLATLGKENVKSIAVNVSNLVGLFSGANAFFPEAGEPEDPGRPSGELDSKEGFTTALWRQSNEITTADCRNMLVAAGFSTLMGTDGIPRRPLRLGGNAQR